ncbi:MAG: hypothetical protein HY614_05420, partial [Candidatus Rokubacteria bacterium]|nr:hypothetical protein [Candidatus Rokubacteria bacterium]
MNVGPERTAEALRVRLGELARLRSEASPVVSVYLDTRWTDEHQRERARVFLKRELARARAGGPSPDLAEDLAWVETRGERVIEQDEHANAGGIALFACRSLGLREVLPVRTPFEDTFVVGDRPAVGPLAALGEDVAPTLIVFVDGQRARLIPLHAAGRGEEVTLAHDVSGRHRRGGWALLAQSR